MIFDLQTAHKINLGGIGKIQKASYWPFVFFSFVSQIQALFLVLPPFLPLLYFLQLLLVADFIWSSFFFQLNFAVDNDILLKLILQFAAFVNRNILSLDFHLDASKRGRLDPLGWVQIERDKMAGQSNHELSLFSAEEVCYLYWKIFL